MKISILGATGSIGMQTLDVVRTCLPDAKIVALSGYSNMEELEKLAEEFKPQAVWIPDASCKIDTDAEILTGDDGLISCAAETGADIVVNALVGRVGLAPTIAAVKAKKDIALANKETLVSAGELVMRLAYENDIRITPIDSEHSAIWQCMQKEMPKPRRQSLSSCGTKENSLLEKKQHAGLKDYNKNKLFAWGFNRKDLEKIILTASGGPFRGWTKEKISQATAADALKHPNWNMGAKITIDSATMMNKGLELIEAMHLFGQEPEKIEIVVHPQSIVHSMVQFFDGAIIAQMGLPDMRLPILYALSAPQRVQTDFERLNFLKHGTLSFEPPDLENFPCLKLAIHAAKTGGTLPAFMNYINEWAVNQFLQNKIKFYEISEIIDKAFSIYNVGTVSSLEDVREAEQQAAEFIERI